MRSRLLPILIVSVFCAGVSSCASRVETQIAFPPAADLIVEPEPAYPESALLPGESGAVAEKAWWLEVLAWGRNHHDRLARVCGWAKELGLEAPDSLCGLPPIH